MTFDSKSIARSVGFSKLFVFRSILGEKQLPLKRYTEGEFQKRTSLLDFYVLCSAASPNYFTFYKYSQRQTRMNEGQKQFNCKIVTLIRSNS